MADSGSKNLLGLLNGIARRDFHNDGDITDEFLKEELYPDITDEEFGALRKRSSSLLKAMASADMDTNQMEAFLTSQTKRREGALSETDAKIYSKFWNNNKTKIHDSFVSGTCWNNSLKGLSWRIDLKTQAKHIDQINTPTAIVELQVEDRNKKDDVKVVRFEMDSEKMSEVLQSIGEVEQAIQKYAQK